MDPGDTKEIWGFAKKLKKSGILVELLLGGFAKFMLRKRLSKKDALELLTSSLSEGPRIAKDLIQSLLLFADTLEMWEVDLEFYRGGAFQSMIQV